MALPEGDYVRKKGGEALGARLRRISEKIDRDATRSYKLLGIEFEQRWFGILNQLAMRGRMTVGEIAAALKITHASVSQASASLQNAKLIESKPDKNDARRKMLSLTDTGQKNVETMQPLWTAQIKAASALNDEIGDLTPLLDRLEDALEAKSLYDRIAEELSNV